MADSFQNNRTNTRPENESSGADFDLGLLIFLSVKSIPWVLIIILLSIASAYTFLHYTAPVFESKSIIQLTSDNQANRILNVEDIYQNSDISKEIELIRSPEFFKRVVNALPIDISYFSEGEVLIFERYKGSPITVDFKVKNPLLYDIPIYATCPNKSTITLSYTLSGIAQELQLSFNDSAENDDLIVFITENFSQAFELLNPKYEDKFFFVLNSQAANIRSLGSSYSVQVLNSSARTVQISVQNQNGLKAAEICDKIGTEFIQFDLERRSQSANKILKFVNEQLNEVFSRLKESESLIKDFKQENRLSENSNFSASFVNRLNELDRTKTELDVELNILKELISNINAEETGVNIYSLLPVLAGNEFESSITLQIKELQSLVMTRNRELSNATPENPTIIIYDQQIEIQKTLILNSLFKLQENLTSNLGTVKAKIDEIEKNFSNLPSQEIEFARLQRIYNSNEKYYTLLLEKKTEYAISEAGYVPGNTVLQTSNLPKTPISPSKGITYGIAVGVSLALISLLILIRYLSHNEISGLQDLDRLIDPGISRLGIVPKYSQDIPLSQLVVDKKPKSIMAESFRSIRSNLEFFESNSEKKVISVTSTISGEGKTFVALNLGGILAFGGKRVIILDLDMRKPRIHKGFNATNEFGMSTLLSARDEIGNLIRKSELENLHFITAGPIPPNPSELIINGRLSKAIETLKHELDYDIVIIDNPPVGLVTDGITCMKMADYPIYIVRSEYSKKNFTFNINRLYHESNLKNLSVILNSVNLDRARYGNYGSKYGSGYGYGYGYGYGNGYGYTSNGYYDEDSKSIKKGLFSRLKKDKKNDDSNHNT
jgi:tyrosine-protein kinase Etk/Wzc